MSKKGNNTTEQEFTLFPELASKEKKEVDKYIRDDLNFAKHPLCVFSPTEEKVVTWKPTPDTTWQLISNPDAGSKLPSGRHLDYLYAMIYLFERG